MGISAVSGAVAAAAGPADGLPVALALGLSLCLAAAAVVAVLWLLARRSAARALADARRRDLDLVELRLTLAEQTSRLAVSGELQELAAASIASLVTQADTVRRLSVADLPAAARAAERLGDAARAALADLRRAVTLARDGEADAAELGPPPGFDTLDQLLDAMRADGLEVELTETGERLPLRAGAELAVYRILTEALRNSLTHGGLGTVARVGIRWSDEGLQLLVEDDGERAAARRAGLDPDQAAQQRAYTAEDDLAALTDVPYGRGLTEMRERTRMFGGVFTVARSAGVGFSVSAHLPALLHHNGVHGVRL